MGESLTIVLNLIIMTIEGLIVLDDRLYRKLVKVLRMTNKRWIHEDYIVSLQDTNEITRISRLR